MSDYFDLEVIAVFWMIFLPFIFVLWVAGFFVEKGRIFRDKHYRRGFFSGYLPGSLIIWAFLAIVANIWFRFW